MRKTDHRLLATIAIAFVVVGVTLTVAAQSGGGFEITDGIVAGSAGSSSNGDVQVDGLTGQPLATGSLSFGTITLTSGFWTFNGFAPTAAHVTIAGRVVDPTGNGLPNAILYMHTQDGLLRLARSSPFGYYQFEGIAAGQTVLITVKSKRFSYASRTVNVAEDIVDLDFIPEVTTQATDDPPQYD